MKMKAFIITEGGRNIGFGHITRCISLYQAFEIRELLPELIVNGDDSVKSLLKDKNYQIFNWLEEKERLFKLVKNADIAIVDSYLADISFYEKLSGSVKLTLYMDDADRLDYPRGVVVNGSIYAEGLDYVKKKGVTYLLGTKYTPLRKEFWDVQEKKIKETIESVMITFGGNDSKNMIPEILRYLKKGYSSLRKNIVIGKGFKNIDEIKEEADKNTNLIYYPHAKKVKEIMLGSDVVISAGGQTLYELARVGVATIGICVAENQSGNLIGWDRAGFIEYAGWYRENDVVRKLKSSINNLGDVKVRKSKSKIGRELVDGKGALRIIKSLLFTWFKNGLSLRKTVFEDALDIFNLSNDDVVRKNSFNPEKMEWEHHLEWLKGKLEDKNCIFFIVVDNLNEFYGQIRLDINPNIGEGIINVSFKKDIRGLGLFSFIMDKSITELLKSKSVKLIKAYVKEDNMASIRAFERAKFRFLENLIIEGNKSRVYVRWIE